MSIMKIGGKSPSDTAVGVSVTADGKVNSVRALNMTKTYIIDTTPASGDTIYTDRCDFSTYGVVSLRVFNTTGKAFTLRVLQDHAVGTSETAYLYDTTGGSCDIALPNNQFMIITPDDFQVLNYLFKPKFSIIWDEAPSSGTLAISVIHKE